jgi:hypothetical protein
MRPSGSRLPAAVLLAFAFAACAGDRDLPQVVSPSRPDTLAAQPVPATLDDAIQTLARGLSGRDFLCMQALGEGDALNAMSQAIEWIAQHWIAMQDSAFRRELTSAGFDDNRAMAEAVVVSFWRRLHGHPVALRSQARQASAILKEIRASRRWALLPDTEIPKLAHPCSRGAPGPITGTWRPDESTLRAVERALPPALQEAIDANPRRQFSAKLRSEDYYHQYAGVIVGGKRLVYVNGFHESYLWMWPHTLRFTLEWRERAIAVCDGGMGFFGAEYDPESGRVSSIDFNSPG